LTNPLHKQTKHINNKTSIRVNENRFPRHAIIPRNHMALIAKPYHWSQKNGAKNVSKTITPLIAAIYGKFSFFMLQLYSLSYSRIAPCVSRLYASMTGRAHERLCRNTPRAYQDGRSQDTNAPGTISKD